MATTGHSKDRWIVLDWQGLGAATTDIYYAPFGATDMTTADDVGPFKDVKVKEIGILANDANVSLESIDAHFLDQRDRNLWLGTWPIHSLAYNWLKLECEIELRDLRNMSVTIYNASGGSLNLAIYIRYEPIK